MSNGEVETFRSIWDALENSPAEAARMQACGDLMIQISAIIHENRWTAAEASSHLRISPERTSELLNGRIDLFSVDDLLEFASNLGRKVRIEIEAA